MDDNEIDLVITSLEFFIKTYNLSKDINISNTISKIKNIRKFNNRYKLELLKQSSTITDKIERTKKYIKSEFAHIKPTSSPEKIKYIRAIGINEYSIPRNDDDLGYQRENRYYFSHEFNEHLLYKNLNQWEIEELFYKIKDTLTDLEYINCGYY